jgi:hypothetical protein
LRLEDAALAGWVAAVSPLLFRATGERGPFDGGQPLAGFLRLAAVAGVLVCLSARRQPDASGKPPESMINRGVVGPFVGGLLLVTISGFTALGASSAAVYVVLGATAIAAIAVRLVLPPLAVAVRRALVAPFGAVAGGLYWTFIEAVIGTPGTVAAAKHSVIANLSASLLPLGFLVAFSAVYYAMLIYAPRQVAEKEGGLVEWLLRYALFVFSIVVGATWLGILTA